MKNKAWLYVILTCIFEIFWVFGFNTAHTWWHWGVIVGVIAVDFHFLSKACEHLATGTVYAVFAGAGTVGTFLMDVFLFGGSFSVGKLFFIVMVVAGVIGLKLADNKEETAEEIVKGAA
ncbi:hypothetical protein IEK_04517 [Bacillus toyonensis]|uniref:DMT family transporter n=1 Tax=Bacillus cereus group TaxID=86661 RepID=UPI00027BEE0C|nr:MULTISPECIES: SMR family transporter [Bacillus cereus group]ARC29693.1 QacE family quaternary ammonium compound efflux SMR transporter [Bacillus sp. FDAARGOS_235]EJV46260.1 hypothetical protein IEK_04517 [Bacillus toyonensis]PEI56023.1 QacE family quaternary ammonium compound efflux SMR transporter [Bacillus toyonensis]PEP13228.1 QacE family quaternary ammonium compound efflux SMR transporter [Bacillus toyonensis]PGE47179.1 QacE family quaternary ammonium compound efflux SMR transporter [Ba